MVPSELLRDLFGQGSCDSYKYNSRKINQFLIFGNCSSTATHCTSYSHVQISFKAKVRHIGILQDGVFIRFLKVVNLDMQVLLRYHSSQEAGVLLLNIHEYQELKNLSLNTSENQIFNVSIEKQSFALKYRAPRLQPGIVGIGVSITYKKKITTSRILLKF